MQVSKKNLEIRNALSDFNRRVDEMHNEFSRFRHREIQKMPECERLEKELVIYSRRKIFDLELSSQLDRILHKFQNRKKIWLRWVEEVHRAG
ncbi:MAG: hypothetical protein JJE15_02540 [Desulfobacteraceae bacterium]|nr:hypothetical protein [Desulfobacteraceae bacterium]